MNRLRLLLLVSALCLSACGFHLRGMGEATAFPFASLRVVGGGSLGEVVLRQLSLQPSLKLVATDPADALLTVEAERLDKQVLTVNRSGRVSEYQLLYRARFQLDVGGKPWIEPTVLTLRREYSFDERNPLGIEAQEALLLRDMRLDATQQIIRRLAVAKAAGGAAAATP